MKFVVALLLSAVVAVKLRDEDKEEEGASPDCPDSQTVFSYNERTHPAAAGFLQVTACSQYSVDGVTCLPNHELFASGMNGDEDLGVDIKMKGEPFHFEQKAGAHAQFASGMNGDEDLGVDIKMKGEPFHFEQKPVSHAQFASGMNGDEDLGVDIKMKGEPYHFEQTPINVKLFASGMNGDEDLGVDIKMKGEPFHFEQKQ